MTYAERLRKRWVVVRLLPKCQSVDVAYFFRYSDAQSFAHLMSRFDRADRFEVMYELDSQRCSIDRKLVE